MSKRYNIFLHLLFWSISVSISVLDIFSANLVAFNFFRILIAVIYHSIIFYFFYFLFVPTLFFKKRIILFTIAGFGFVGLYSIPVTYAYSMSIEYLYHFLTAKSIGPTKFVSLYPSVVYSQFMYALYGSLFRISNDWSKNRERQSELEKQNITNELALLRSQINPHFLFNTLNNLHSYIYREPDKASFGIIKLSEIMRYMLYESDVKLVPIEKEIQHIQSYIELQKLRYSEPDYVQFTIENETINTKIPPFLLITFVENAFKHGKTKGRKPCIIINLSITKNTLLFVTENYVKSVEMLDNSSSGFGLKNIKRRLELLYPNCHSLNISTQNDKFVVHLIINNP